MLSKRKCNQNPASPNRSYSSLLARSETAMGTKEEIRQRRFDSLARLLSLGSDYSACAAVTIYENELIVAINCAEAMDPSAVQEIMTQRIVILREILKKNTNTTVSAVKLSNATKIYADDLKDLEKFGGFYQPKNIVAQALYKLCKSILNKINLDASDNGFSPDEIDVLMYSTNITILVPAELEDDEDNLKSALDFSFVSSISEEDSIDLDDFLNKSINQNSFVSAGLMDFKSNLDNQDSSSDSDSDSSSTVSTDMADESSPFEGLHLNESTSEDNFILTSIEKSLEESFNEVPSFFKQPSAIRYGMNVYGNQKLIQIVPFPESIYLSQNRPLNVTGFHAEQMIVYYLKEEKKTDLHDKKAEPIALGISKLCCDACNILYQFPRISIRGSSFNNIRGVPNILTESDNSFNESSSIEFKKRYHARNFAFFPPAEASFVSPKKTPGNIQRTVPPSPFS